MAMKEFIFEIGTEEIPAGFMPPALSSLKSIAAEALQAARIEHGEIETSGTPRRMVLVIRELSDRQPDITEETMGPSVNVAFDADGNPTKAGMGFARSRGVEVGDLLRVTTDKGEYIAVKQTIKGRPTKELLKEELPRWLSKLPFRKSMRWGSGEVAFVRPIHWLLALFGGEIIEFEYAGANSGNISRGHRFHAPASFEVAGVEDYFKKISEASVIIDPAVRKEMIREQVAAEAAKVGGKVLEDEDLLNTVNFLLELPTAVSGTFEEHYLELPRELLILTMKTHQKYFAVVDDAGNLMNYFITVSNTRARDMSVVAKGNERVLRARLSDASFFFVEDQKKPLEEHLEGLKKVVFQSKLGTSYEKVERFTANATSLAGSICPGSEATVGRIAKLAKADLETLMVYEFPEIQGAVGREYAKRAGEPEIVFDGILQHYYPVQAGGELPGTPEADCVSMGDKIDTIVGCFGVGLIPSGSADPYALRRQTIGILRIIIEKGYRLSIGGLIDLALGNLADKLTREAAEVKADVLDFFKGRLEVILLEGGATGDVVAAVLAAGFDDAIDAKARVEAIETVRECGDLVDLAATFKRAANILKKESVSAEVDEALFNQEEERALWKVYSEVKSVMESSIEAGDFLALFAEAAKLKVVVDAFFDKVMVMDKDEAVKNNRIAMLGAVTALFQRVADFTRIAG